MAQFLYATLFWLPWRLPKNTSSSFWSIQLDAASVISRKLMIIRRQATSTDRTLKDIFLNSLPPPRFVLTRTHWTLLEWLLFLTCTFHTYITSTPSNIIYHVWYVCALQKDRPDYKACKLIMQGPDKDGKPKLQNAERRHKMHNNNIITIKYHKSSYFVVDPAAILSTGICPWDVSCMRDKSFWRE